MDISNMDIHIDPQEVLAHLHGMGYLNISPDQLKSFIADLKKLIKYDVRRCNCSIESLRSQAVNSLDLTDNDEETENVLGCHSSTSNLSSNISVDVEDDNHALAANHCEGVYQNTQAGHQSTTSRGHINRSGEVPAHHHTLTEHTRNSGSGNVRAGHRTLTERGYNSGSENVQAEQYVYERKTIRGSVLVKKTSKERKSSKDSQEEAMITVAPSRCPSSARSSCSRPRSSFIMPRQPQAPLSVRRSDPVALYHKYQSYWQQQKVPGDNHHELLRWNVRERMLGGGDPVPRPMSRAASVDKVNRPSWNYR